VFPFFTNVDEPLHFDLIWKYSHAEWASRDTDREHPEVSRYVVYFASPEYLYKPGDFRSGRYPAPRWTLPERQQRYILASRLRIRMVNHEQYSPPLYYALAGAWLNVGEHLGFREAALLYWTRFLNVPLYLVVMVLSLVAGRWFFANRPVLFWGLPILVAVIPQDVFYSLNSDVLTPIPCMLVFLLTCRLLAQGSSGPFMYAAVGMVSSAALLVKLANVPVLIWTGTVLLACALKAYRSKQVSGALINTAVLMICLCGPLAIWGLRNHALIGDWTGTQHKIDILGWSYKSLAEIFPHPIGTLSGLTYFFENLIGSFWRGELTWGLEPIRVAGVDCFLTVSTLLFLGISVYSSIRRFHDAPGDRPVVFGVAGVVAAVVYLVFLSMIFDFHQCFYPSRQQPFFVSGRLLLCVMFPLLISYAYGLDKLMGILKVSRYTLHVLLLLGALITVIEVFISLPVFQSTYNLWNLPSGSLLR
jgi:hypothetical protein